MNTKPKLFAMISALLTFCLLPLYGIADTSPTIKPLPLVTELPGIYQGEPPAAPEIPELLFGYDWSFSKNQYVSFFYPVRDFGNGLHAGLVAGYERDTINLNRLDKVRWGIGGNYRINIDPFYIAGGLNFYLPTTETPGDVTCSIMIGLIRKF